MTGNYNHIRKKSYQERIIALAKWLTNNCTGRGKITHHAGEHRVMKKTYEITGLYTVRLSMRFGPLAAR